MSYPNKATPEFKFSKEMQSPLDVEAQTKILNVCWKPLFRSFKSSHQDVFLRKGVVKISSKFTGEHPCRSAISIKLLCNFIEIALWHGCSALNLLHIFRTPFPRNTSGWLLLKFGLYFREKFKVAPLFFGILATYLFGLFKGRTRSINLKADFHLNNFREKSGVATKTCS